MVLAFIRVVRRTELENLCSHMRSKKQSTKLFIVSFIINRSETELLSSALQIRPILGDLASRIEDSGIRTSRTANKKKGCAGRQTNFQTCKSKSTEKASDFLCSIATLTKCCKDNNIAGCRQQWQCWYLWLS